MATHSIRSVGQPSIFSYRSGSLFHLSGLLVLLAALASGCAKPSGASGDGDGDKNPSAGDGDSMDGSTDGSGGDKNDIDIGTGGDGSGDGDLTGDGDMEDPCLGPMPPADCELDYEPSGPGCGDGKINTDDEECDDGNGLPGDGCTGLCEIEPNWVCNDNVCQSTIVCGNGTTEPGEVCDDGNTTSDDGCAADCFIEIGFNCPPDGGACAAIEPCLSLSPPAECFPPPGSNPYCGDAVINNTWEVCDDGNALPGDGCNGACAIEPNWNCSSGTCVSTIVCGNGVVEVGEVCDDGDTTSGNGCQSDCLSITPGYSCPPSGGACSTVDPCKSPAPPPSCQNTGGGGPPPPFCGDGTKNQTAEQCDDGNTRPGDGCSGACKVEPNYNCSTGTCVSTIVCGNGLVEPGEVCDDGDTTPGNGCESNCLSLTPSYSCPPMGGPCAFVDPCNSIAPPASCQSTGGGTPKYCGDGAVNRAPEQCDDGNTRPGDGCSGTCLVEPNFNCSSGTCVSTIICGNGTVEPGEVCDDGDTTSGNGCNADCLSLSPNYSCPPAGGACTALDPCASVAPPASCNSGGGGPPPPYCGDGAVNKAGEVCDDGNTRPGDGCSGACKVEPNWNCSSGTCVSTIVCGDGVVGPGEVCDDGDTVAGNGCESNCLSITPNFSCPPAGGQCLAVDPCTRPNPPASCNSSGGGGDPDPYCGDGNLDSGEACDDGNFQPGDGCSGACNVEPNWNCSSGTCVQTIVCGDGAREGSEVCDDGNLVSGDGCSDACQTIDPNYVCPPAGGNCTNTMVCGDGRITGGEQCEDGDTQSGDGCSNTCMLEPGYYCPTVGASCQLTPYCGDGAQTAGEQCDDGGSASPGCDATCKIESGYACPVAGQDCLSITVICGNGVLEGDESCDDGNTTGGDGCSATCVKGTAYTCPNVGKLCIPICGDGLVRGNESCDDGNTSGGDGCSAGCNYEPGYYCDDQQPTFCATDFCGNGEVGNDEACDDGNNRPGDGCAGDCTAEPNCSTYGPNGCTSICGDGLIINEQCDDGNSKNGDGCSSTCTIETGFSCQQPTGCSEYADWDHDNNLSTPGVSTCIMRVPVTYRDVNESHSDFQPGWDSTGTKLLVNNNLNGNGKPTWNTGNTNGFITSTTSFNQWYNDSGQSNTIVDELVLWDNGSGGFVNRWGDEGQRWINSNVTLNWCGDNTQPEQPWNRASCATCQAANPSWNVCYQNCTPWGQPNTVCAGPGGNVSYDGNPVFFPIDYHPDARTLVGGYATAGIAPDYGGNWDSECNNPNNTACASGTPVHNFHFTSEVRQWFKYETGNTYVLDFTGDDDVWVFINGKLAVDLGGWHAPQNGSVTINNGNASTWQLVNGRVYEIVVFQAERKFSGSSYKLTLSGFNTNPSVCNSVCGDGVVASTEECDDGVNDGGYGECQPGCVLGPFCGDGIKQAGEGCDNGLNLSGWNDTSAGACAPGCVKPAFCGDGIVNPAHEICDNGAANANGAYGGCTTLCLFGPYCGDGIKQTGKGEECDDGVNDGTAGCGPTCKSTISCGNGTVDPGESCDDGVNNGGYGECQPGCVDGPYCGDGFPDAPNETCDDGTNNGSYGGCSPICQMGPFCGDSIVNGSEDCDDGQNDGGYGECRPGCRTGSYCGDGIVNGPEQCDDGTNNGSVTACTGGCVWGPFCGDGVVNTSAGEICDDGSNLGGYNKCAPMCKPGPYCGDSAVQSAYEECDDGDNDGGYGECATGCQLGPFCGDGQINGGETCDDAVNNGAYGRCAPDCTTGSYCGDGIKQDEEQCDDGTNDGSVSSCTAGCVLGPGCGDGLLQDGEECDFGPGNSAAYNGCNSCKWGPRCGDGAVQAPYEQCDDGTNPGGYGQCAQNCRFGPYCGDGLVSGGEICDDGINDGGYGECAPACKLGPYCGDGKLNAKYEACDDGNRKNNDGCSSSCKIEVVTR